MTEPTYRDPSASTAERVSDLLGRMTLEEKVAQLGAMWVNQLVTDDALDETKAAEVLAEGIGQVTRIGASTGLLPDESAALMNGIQKVVIERTRLGVPIVVHEESVAGFLSRGATTFPQGIGLAATWDTDLVGEIAEVIRTQMLAVGARHSLSPVLDVARDGRWGRVEETYGESPELCARLGVAYVSGLQTSDLANGVVCTGKHFLGYGASLGGRNHAPVHVGPRELREVYAEPFAAAIREAGLASMMNSYSSIDGLPCAGSHEILTALLRDELGFEGTVVADYFAVMQLELNHRTAASREEAAAQALSAGLDIELPALDYYKVLPDMVRSGSLDEAVVDTAVERVLAQKFALGLFENPYVDAAAAPLVFDTDDQRALARRAAAEGVCLLSNDGALPLGSNALERVALIGPHADDPRLLQGDYHYPTHLEIIYDSRPEELANIVSDDTPGVEMLPEAGGSFQPGPHYTPHITPLAGLREALPGVDVTYARGCHDSDAADQDIDAATAIAAGSDVAVVCVGSRSGLTGSATVGEARDAVSLDLPGAQADLVAAVAATGTPTVVVVISGRVHTLGEVDDVANALLWSPLPGEEGGNGIADVLTGQVNPSGRLPVTLPRHVGQIPIHHDMRARGDRSEFYGDYVDSPAAPLFAFGHGLSYTDFEYSDLEVSAGSTTEPTNVAVTVSNIGDIAGDEVIQLYVRDDFASVARPIKELLGFTRISLDPGSASRVTFAVDPSRLAFHGADMALATEPGTFTFWVGASSADLRLEATVELGGPKTEYDRRSIVATTNSIAQI